MPGEQIDIDVWPGKDEGIYLFCFARPHALPSPKPRGLDDRHSVSQWVVDDVMAVVSTVSLEEFCGPLAEGRMKDLSWIGPRASRHEEVIEQLVRHTPVLPARFGTIFSSLKQLGRLVNMHRDTISRFLDRTMGKDEWSVKGIMDTSQAKEKVLSAALSRDAERLAALSPGMRYFQEQRIRSGVDRELQAWLREACGEIWKDLKSRASDCCERRVLSHNPPGMDGDMVLNWAFLMSRDSVEDFRACVDQLRLKYAEQGLSFHLSGPWPPYSFCPPLEMAEYR
jgi:hypothetical protein